MANGPTVSLLICDDHKVLTDALSMVVGLDPSLSLVAAPVHTPEEGVALADRAASRRGADGHRVQRRAR